MNPTEPTPPSTVVPPGEFVNADPPTGGVVPTVASQTLTPGPVATTEEPINTASPIPVGPGPGQTIPPVGTPVAAGGVVQPATTIKDGETVTSVALKDLASDDPAVQKFVSDAEDLGAKARSALATMLDTVFKDGVDELPILKADLVPAAEAIIENNTSPTIGNIIKGLAGIASPIANPTLMAVSQKTLSGIQDFAAYLKKFV